MPSDPQVNLPPEGVSNVIDDGSVTITQPESRAPSSDSKMIYNIRIEKALAKQQKGVKLPKALEKELDTTKTKL